MVVIPNTKITVLGGNISPTFELWLSLKIQQQLLIPTLSFDRTGVIGQPQRMKIDSIGAAVINCKMNFSDDVWAVNPKDVEVVRKQIVDKQRFFPRSITTISEIAFVRSIEKIRFEVNQLQRGDPIELEGYKVTFKTSMHKIVGDVEGPLREKLGRYFLPY